MEATGGLVALYKLDTESRRAEHVATGLYWSVSDDGGQVAVSCEEMWVRKPDAKPPLVAVFFSGEILSVGVQVGMPVREGEGRGASGGFVKGPWKAALGKFWSPIPPLSERSWRKTVVDEGKLGEGLAVLAERAGAGKAELVPLEMNAEPQKLP